MIWLIGSGGMAKDYIKVLKGLGEDFVVIGRGEESAQKMRQECDVDVHTGGLEKFLASQPESCKHAIVSVGVEQLATCTQQLINYGVKNILCEKPGALNTEEIKKIHKELPSDISVSIAYNRRFYASVLKAEEIIKEDGGVSSFNFEFTEWGHVIEKLGKPQNVFNNWLAANSSHVIDLAFFLGGRPRELKAFSANKNQLSWHEGPTNYAGAGISEQGALFNYAANWCAPGRWGVEVLTRKHRLYLRPMEQLHLQELGSVKVELVEIDDVLDRQYKPGLYLQTKSFLEKENRRLCTLEQQADHFSLYDRIRGAS